MAKLEKINYISLSQTAVEFEILHEHVARGSRECPFSDKINLKKNMEKVRVAQRIVNRVFLDLLFY